jgi:hypothetical protein
MKFGKQAWLMLGSLLSANATGVKAEPITSNSGMPMYEVENVPVSCGLLPNELKEREETIISGLAKATRGYVGDDRWIRFQGRT